MNEVIVSVKDTNFDFLYPRLFSKVVNPSMKGEMWGFFISKSIIEASGGRIWAEKNADGKGATFMFGLPVIG
jgi:signal transduction histidine kinase